MEARLINKPSEWPSQPEDALNVVGGAPLESADRHSAKPSRDSSGMICARQFFVLDFGRLLGVLFDTTCIHKMVRNVGLYLPRMKGYVLDWLQMFALGSRQNIPLLKTLVHMLNQHVVQTYD